jgi:large subunit ribosomal protein L3
MKCILGKKLGMTQVFLENGEVIPVTRVEAGPCQIVQVRAVEEQGEKGQSLQLGFEEKKEWRLSKPLQGHLKGLNPVRYLREFFNDEQAAAERGDMVTVDTFVKGDVINVIGTSKGKGFAGVVKRYHFGGGPASHGHKDNLRARGSSGAGGVQRVFKGMRMAGRMGGERVTVKNLEIIEVHPETNELLIKGALPGGRNGLIMITAPGKLVLKKNTAPVAEVVPVMPEAGSAQG